MTTATHSIVGMTTGVVVYNTGIITEYSQLGMVIIGLLISNVPDINVLWHKSNLHSHHKDTTHYPIFWVVMVIVIFCFESLYSESLNHFWSLFVGVSVLLHLLMDTFGNTIGVHWFYPFSMKEYSFTKLKRNLIGSSVKDMLSKDYHGNHIWIELLVWTICLSIIVWDF